MSCLSDMDTMPASHAFMAAGIQWLAFSSKIDSVILSVLCWCAVQNAGLQGGTKESGGPVGNSSLASWGEWELHRLVAHFLAARFPIMLALNKVS